MSINNWEWVADLKQPRATWKCDADAEWPAARLHQPSDRASILRNGRKSPSKKGG
jgi:hypothetical protein